MRTHIKLCVPGQDLTFHTNLSISNEYSTELVGCAARIVLRKSNLLDEKQGIQWLHGKTGAECQARILTAFTELSKQTPANMWERSPGQLLLILWNWCVSFPHGVFNVCQ